MKHNSIVNQEIKGMFIAQHVFLNVNSMTEYILNKGYEDRNAPFSWDDVSNFYRYPELSYHKSGKCFEGGTQEDLNDEIEATEQIISEMEENDPEDPKIEDYRDYLQELNDLETYPAEIFEWWAVSSYLAEQLKEKGECILEDECIWGRQTTGQAILLDGVISRICEDMEILEGQQNAWK